MLRPQLVLEETQLLNSEGHKADGLLRERICKWATLEASNPVIRSGGSRNINSLGAKNCLVAEEGPG